MIDCGFTLRLVLCSCIYPAIACSCEKCLIDLSLSNLSNMQLIYCLCTVANNQSVLLFLVKLCDSMIIFVILSSTGFLHLSIVPVMLLVMNCNICSICSLKKWFILFHIMYSWVRHLIPVQNAFIPWLFRNRIECCHLLLYKYVSMQCKEVWWKVGTVKHHWFAVSYRAWTYLLLLVRENNCVISS